MPIDDLPIETRLETPRLTLRELDLCDWPAVHEYASDPAVSQFLPWGPNSEQQTLEYLLDAIALQKETPRRQFHLAIAQKDDDRLIGACSIGWRGAPQSEETWIGYVLNRSFWGLGLMPEAAAALLCFGFGPLGASRIQAVCDADNASSARVLEKIGMRLVRRLERHEMRKGAWRDFFLYRVTKTAWESRI